MCRRWICLIGCVGVVAFLTSTAWSHPPRRAHRHHGPHTHVYVQHEHYGSSLRGFPRTPYVHNYSLGVYPPLWYGWGPRWGYWPGAWIDPYPWWGWSGGYYGAPSYYYPGYYGASIETGAEVPYIVGNGFNDEVPAVTDDNGLPLTTIVKADGARDIQPEIREWLPAAKPNKAAAPADPADTLRSVRYQTEADLLFRKGDYTNAYLMYSRAAVMDESRAEPRLRMGLASAATHQFDRALRELRHAFELNPELAQDNETFGGLFGDDNAAAKSEFVAGVRRWAEQNIGDADRLFLLGVILQFDEQLQNAAPLFQQVARTVESDPHVGLFLSREIDEVGLRIIGSRKDKADVPAPPAPGEGLPAIVPADVEPPPARVPIQSRMIERFGKSKRAAVPKPPLPLDELPAEEAADDPVEAKRPTTDTGPIFPGGE